MAKKLDVSKAAQALGSIGGKATASRMTKQEKHDRAVKGAAKRWENATKKPKK